MKLVVQRVKSARVVVKDEVVGGIGHGALILVGVLSYTRALGTEDLV